MSKRSIAQLKTLTDQVIKTNNAEQITAAKDNPLRKDFLDSYLNLVDGGLVVDEEVGYSTPIEPSQDYSFATKKYVDDATESIDLSEYIRLDGSSDPTTGFIKIGDSKGFTTKTNFFVDPDNSDAALYFGANTNYKYIQIFCNDYLNLLNDNPSSLSQLQLNAGGFTLAANSTSVQINSDASNNLNLFANNNLLSYSKFYDFRYGVGGSDGFGIRRGNLSFGSILKADNITGSSKTHQLPNASGTIALTSDIPSASDYILIDGTSDPTTGTIKIGIGQGLSLSDSSAQVLFTPGSLVLNSSTRIEFDSDGGEYNYYNTTNNKATFNFESLTANRNIVWQNKAYTGVADLSDIPAEEEIVGEFISDTFSSLGSWDTTSGGGSFSAVSNELVVSTSGSIALTKRITNTHGTSNFEDVIVKNTIRVGTINSTSHGVSFGFQTASGGNRSIDVAIRLDSTNLGFIEIYGENNLAKTARSNRGFTPVAGDLLDVVVRFNKNRLTINIIKNGTKQSLNSFVYKFSQSDPNFSVLQRTGCFLYSIGALGGTHYVRDYTVECMSPKGAIVVLGDSITQGIYSTQPSNSWVGELEKQTNLKCVRYAGSGGGLTTMNVAEILMLEPSIIINFLGTNNTSLSTTDWLTAYQAVMTPLISGGYVVGETLFTCSLLPRNSIDVRPYNQKLIDTYTGYIDLFNPYANSGTYTISTDYSSDGLHPNGFAAKNMASVVHANILPYIRFVANQTTDGQYVNYQENGNVAISRGNGYSANWLLSVQNKSAGVGSIMFVGNGGEATGGWFTGNSGGIIIHGNCYFTEAGTHIAKSTTPSFMVIGSSGHQFYANTGATIGSTFTPALRLTIGTSAITFSEGYNLIAGTTTGTKIGTATTQKIGFWNATPVVQPTTAISAATFVANTSGTLNDSATYGGYTIGQVVAALKQIGMLA